MEDTDKLQPQDAAAEAAPPPEDGQAEPGPLPAGSAPDDAAALQGKLEAAQAKAAEYLDGWQRARAEFANYKKRVEREQAELHLNTSGRIIARYLDVLDDFERALADPPTEGDAARWADGVALILRKLRGVLEAEGVERIEAEGQPFDPNLHEAVLHEESGEHASGHITGVLRQGYRIGERVIRPALVRVAK